MLIRRAFPLERRAHPRDPALADWFGVTPTSSGAEVTTKSALSWPAFSAGVRILSEDVASLPLNQYERLQPRGRQLVPDRTHQLLHDQPNDEQTSFEFRELLQGHLCIFGNAYAQIVQRNDGTPQALWPLNPDRVRIDRDAAGRRIYHVSVPKGLMGPPVETRILPANEVLHLRGWSLDGIWGLDPVKTFRETIGLGLATETFGAKFFGQGAHPSGYLEHPAELSEEAQKRIRLAIENQVGGLTQAHRVLVLEEGMKWHQAAVDPEKAQFLGIRKFQVTEASRILRLPPHMLGDLERSTFSNIENEGISYVVHSLTPWLARWEQRLGAALLPRPTARYFKFLVDGLLRGDIKTRYEAYAIARQWGWMSKNDVREKEEMNPVEDGDDYLTPMNMTAGTPPNPEAGNGEDD